MREAVMSDTIEPSLQQDPGSVRMTKSERSAQPATPRYSARDLTAGGPVAEIELDGHVYTLRVTRSQKLILTK